MISAPHHKPLVRRGSKVARRPRGAREQPRDVVALAGISENAAAVPNGDTPTLCAAHLLTNEGDHIWRSFASSLFSLPRFHLELEVPGGTPLVLEQTSLYGLCLNSRSSPSSPLPGTCPGSLVLPEIAELRCKGMKE